MPSPAYTSRRRLLLQLVLVLVFAGTMGLAAAVRHQRQNVPAVPLDKAVTLGSDLTVMLPSTWATEDDTLTGIFPFVRSVQATEPADPRSHRYPRAVRVSVQKADPAGVAAEQFLRSARQVSGGTAQRITVAGQPGVALSERVPTEHEGLSATRLYACGILSDGRAVIVDLQVVAREPSRQDHQLLRDVAAGIRGTSAGGGGGVGR